MQLFSSALLTFRCMQVIVAVLANISESVLSWEKHASQPVYHLSTTTFERWMWPTWIYGAFRSWKAGWGLFKLVFVQWLYYNPIDASSNFLSLRSWALSNFDISPFPAPVKLSSIKNWRIFDSMTISRIFGQHRQKSAPPTQCQWVIETKIFTNMGPPEARDKTLTQQIQI